MENKCVNLRDENSIVVEKPQIVKQEITGVRAHVKLDGWSCLVCSEGWPSGALGISWLKDKTNLVVYCSMRRDLLLATQSVLKDMTFVSFEAAMSIWEENNVMTIIQGSVKFCEDCFRYSERYYCSHTIVIIPYCRFRRNEFKGRNLKWQKVKHQEVGGVSTSAWSIGIPQFLNVLEVKALAADHSFQRRLRDIVKDGEVGKIIECPVRTRMNDTLRLEQAGHLFDLPSFRSRSGWVRRRLSALEIGWLYDMNELVSNDLRKSNSSLLFSDLLEGSVPGKITQLCHMFVAQTWGSIHKDATIEVKSGTLSCQLGLIVRDKAQKDSLSGLDPFLRREANYLVEYGAKASKDDDALVPVELWDRSVLRQKFEWLDYTPRVKAALNTLRSKFAWRIYIQNLVRGFFIYIRSTYGPNWLSLVYEHKRRKANNSKLKRMQTRKELLLDLVVGLDGLKRGLSSSWWEWKGGSTCFYWRWLPELRKEVRDGVRVHVETKLPQFRKPQRFSLSKEDMEKLKGKVQTVIQRGYLQSGYVASLINYFAVPKGTSDIRVVYDGTKSGLTEAVWAPNFFMPSLESLLLYTSASTWFSDMDLGEMFLNYAMDPAMRPYSGVDVSLIVDRKNQGREWMQWGRTFMGFRSSPYIAVKTFNWCLDVVRGDPEDQCNAFRYDHVRLNLPGDPKYNPELPWLCKMNKDKEACDVVEYMDDIRPFGEGEMEVRKAGKRASQVVQYLGQQSADRKYRPPSQEPGPWCGSFLRVYNGSVWVYVSKDKWIKGKRFVDRWLEELLDESNSEQLLEFKDLESGRGFLVYLGRSYPSIVPYLKGIHLTLDSWRKHRDKEGWKEKKPRVEVVEEEERESPYHGDYEEEELYELDVRVFDTDDTPISSQKEALGVPPRRVKAVYRLRSDLEALATFFEDEDPPWRFVRGKEICVAQYGFGDASGSGFGSSYLTPEGIKYRFGSWGKDVGEESSNYRELSNLVDSLIERLDENMKKLTGIEVFLLTDNLVAESAFFKGSSSSKKLFELILKLRQLELSGGFKVHVIHIAGSRMIAQGTDGLSRGDIAEGVMAGETMLEFIPLNKSCLERSPLLRSWILSWLSPLSKGFEQEVCFLSIKDWFHLGHDIVGGQQNAEKLWLPHYQPGIRVWTPPPAAGQHCIEQLRKARLKRTSSTQVFVVPRIFTSVWRKQLYRVADVVVELPFEDGIWAKELQHEPLTLAFLFPFLNHKPWQLKRSYSFLGMGRMLRKLWKDGEIPLWIILHKFCQWTSRLYAVQPSVVRCMLQSAREFELFCRETPK